MSEESCKTCRFFFQFGHMIDGKGTGSGLCRRNAPVKSDVFDYPWPMIHQEARCGEWSHKPQVAVPSPASDLEI